VALIAGSLNASGEFVGDSMAKRIDDALPKRPEFAKEDRRELLIAIATGVIEYLKAHDADSFKVTVTGHNKVHQGSLDIQ
jgi:hypothetical protein